MINSAPSISDMLALIYAAVFVMNTPAKNNDTSLYGGRLYSISKKDWLLCEAWLQTTLDYRQTITLDY